MPSLLIKPLVPTYPYPDSTEIDVSLYDFSQDFLIVILPVVRLVLFSVCNYTHFVYGLNPLALTSPDYGRFLTANVWH